MTVPKSFVEDKKTPKSFVEEQPGFLQQLATPTNIGATVGDVAGEVIPIPGVRSVASGVLSGIGAGIGKTIEQARDDTPGFQLGEIGKTALQEGALSFATPFALKGAGKVALKTGIKEPLEQLLKKGMDPVSNILSKGKGAVKKVIKEKVGDLPLKGLKINASQLSKWKKSHNIDLSKWMNDNKLFGGDAIPKASDIAEKMQDVFDNLALNSKWKIPVKEFNDRFLQEIKKLAPGRGGADPNLLPSVSGEATDQIKLVPKDFKNISKKITEEWVFQLEQLQRQGVTEVTPKILTQLRRMTDELIPKGSFASPGVKNVNFRLRQIYNDIVYKNIESRMLPDVSGVKRDGIRELGKQLNQFYDFLKIAQKQSNLGRGTNLLGLSNLLSGSVGATIGGLPGAIAGVATPSILRNADVLSNLSRTIPKAVSSVGRGLDTGKHAIEQLPGAFGAMTRFLAPRGASQLINQKRRQ